MQEVLRPSSSPPVFRLPLGKEAIEGVRKRVGELRKTVDQLESIAATCES
jgi:hypothetical protein